MTSDVVGSRYYEQVCFQCVKHTRVENNKLLENKFRTFSCRAV